MSRVKLMRRGAKRIALAPRKSNPFFQDESGEVRYFSSGCKLLDLVLGGGWVVGRVVNLVGDKAVGKTLLAIEGTANFLNKFPGASVAYKEVESSFDERYAAALGMPVEAIDFIPHSDTIEELETELLGFIESKNPDQPGLFILDSLDALSDKAEQGRKLDENSMGMNKAKQMSALFRKHNGVINRSNTTFFIISQIRDKVNVSFGKKTTRAGGRALDFYASQVVFLAHLGMMAVTRNKIKRKIGVNIKAFCEKNKVGLPFRDCEFSIKFGYGVDDIAAGIAWLNTIGKTRELGDGWNATNSAARLKAVMEGGDAKELRRDLDEVLEEEWKHIETSFMPEYSKY